jgi:hypothetical protein
MEITGDGEKEKNIVGKFRICAVRGMLSSGSE